MNISRIMPAKDHKNLLSAFRIVHDAYQNTKLICVGTGDLLDGVMAYTAELKLKDSVLFTGTRLDVSDFYNASDCFVLSSAWEGFGIVLAEAMACELPVISTDCGGTREVVQDENWLVSPRNPDELAAKMIDIIKSSKSEREIIGKNNRQLVQKFGIDNITKNWLEIYKFSL